MMLKRAGVWLGNEESINLAYDDLITLPFFVKIITSYISLEKEIDEGFTIEFCKKFETFKESNISWSLKNGETMWCIPFLHSVVPDATYILVVRNGLDNILNDHIWAEGWRRPFGYIANEYKTKNFSLWAHRMIFWNALTKRAIKEGKEYFGDKFLIVRLEDIIESPEEEGKIIFDHLGLDFKPACVNFIKPQESVGKHKKMWTESNWGGHVYVPDVHLENLKELGREMLTELGYMT